MNITNFVYEIFNYITHLWWYFTSHTMLFPWINLYIKHFSYESIQKNYSVNFNRATNQYCTNKCNTFIVSVVYSYNQRHVRMHHSLGLSSREQTSGSHHLKPRSWPSASFHSNIIYWGFCIQNFPLLFHEPIFLDLMKEVSYAVI